MCVDPICAGGVKMDKQKMAALGTSALLSYGFVSNFRWGSNSGKSMQ